MTKKQAASWALIMTLFIMLLLVPLLFVRPAANGAEQAKGPGGLPIPHITVRNQYKVWSRNVELTLPHTDIPSDYRIQATITVEYYYWRGENPPSTVGRRIAPYGVDLCYAFRGDAVPSVLWQGISADSEWFDDKLGVSVQDLRTGDKGKGGCIHEKVPVEHRLWLHSSSKSGKITNPFWLADGWINWAHFPDQSFHWHNKHRIDDSMPLNPRADPVITTKTGKIWHKILKTW